MTETEPAAPSDILLTLIGILLAPVFLAVTNGDLTLARLAALHSINDYRARNQADLIAVAQIVGFGLAALGSLSLSLADDISLSMTLRLRGNAVACNRAAEQNRKARANRPEVGSFLSDEAALFLAAASQAAWKPRKPTRRPPPKPRPGRPRKNAISKCRRSRWPRRPVRSSPASRNFRPSNAWPPRCAPVSSAAPPTCWSMASRCSRPSQAHHRQRNDYRQTAKQSPVPVPACVRYPGI
jgi:hypothetical protein